MLSFIISLLSFALFFSFAVFYLDDFKLSQNKYIKVLQVLFPLLFLLFIILLYYESISIFNNVLFTNDPKNPNISIGAKVEIGKEAAAEISKGVSTIGSNVGLAGTVGAVSAGVAKVISKTSLPPVQKAGIVMVGSLIGGGIHVGASSLNRLNNNIGFSTSARQGQIINSSASNISKLFDDSIPTSDLSNLILSINILTSACLSLIVILSMVILFKFLLNEDKIKFNLSSLVGDKFNNNLNYYLIKIIQLNKKTSTIYIIVIFILLYIGLIFDCYFITELYNNLDKFIDIHVNSRK